MAYRDRAQNPPAKRFCSSRTTRTAARRSRRFAGPMAWFGAQLAARARDLPRSNAAPLEVLREAPEAAVLAQGRDHLRGLAASASRSGCRRSGCSPTARTASAATNWPARSASPRRPRGSCCRGSVSPCRPRDGGKTRRRRRSGRNLHRRQSPQHARGEARSGWTSSADAVDGRQGRRHGPAGSGTTKTAVSTRAPRGSCAVRKRDHLQAPSSATRRNRRDPLHRRAAVLRPDWTPSTSTTSSTTPKATWTGQVHTNGCENFWSLLKRAIKGTYVSRRTVPSVPLPRRASRSGSTIASGTTLSRFALALKGIIGKRLTYTALTGSELPQTC